MLTLTQAREVLANDDDLLRRTIAELPPQRFAGERRALGDACESIRDLVAHHTMWREIAHGVLHEALAGRRHWSTGEAWGRPEAGQRLNRGGVVAGRELLPHEVVQRFESSSQALLSSLDALEEKTWGAELFDTTLGGWLEPHLSVPGFAPFVHVSLHLTDFGRRQRGH